MQWQPCVDIGRVPHWPLSFLEGGELRVSWHSPVDEKRGPPSDVPYYLISDYFEDILNILYLRLSCGNIAIIMIAHDVFRNRE